jgi:hypothetical protein
VGSVFPGKADVSFEFELKVQPKIEPNPMHQCVTTDDVYNWRSYARGQAGWIILYMLLEPTGECRQRTSDDVRLDEVEQDPEQVELAVLEDHKNNQNVATIYSKYLKIPEQKRYLAVTGVIRLTIFQHLRFDTSNCSDI